MCDKCAKLEQELNDLTYTHESMLEKITELAVAAGFSPSTQMRPFTVIEHLTDNFNTQAGKRSQYGLLFWPLPSWPTSGVHK